MTIKLASQVLCTTLPIVTQASGLELLEASSTLPKITLIVDSLRQDILQHRPPTQLPCNFRHRYLKRGRLDYRRRCY
ncbi:hypothetical protein BDR04DRAFT_217211 [Suillus decipiens]|nr:hypothetical protein BDR04DRAFT_217211 [Suillus decipiens]